MGTSKTHFTLVLLLVASLSHALPHLREEETIKPKSYRLPTTVVPSYYDIKFTFYEDIFTWNRFSGEVLITVDIKEDTDEIKLHASRMQITSALLKTDTDLISSNGQSTDEQTEILTIAFAKKATKGTYKLQIMYTGSLIEDEMYGFYKSFYYDSEGVRQLLATTQFEPTFARRAFPSFDEPQFKAVFKLTFTHPSQFSVITNTKQKGETKVISPTLSTEEFEETPRISTYLVAFILSEFSNSQNDIVQIWSKVGTENFRDIVLDQSPKLLYALGNFTNIKYELPKLDVAAIPDFAYGAMENWGLVMFREYLILDDAKDTSQYFKQRIITTVAHEFAHQWFGDLVTMDWWSHTWLNEGFATYFQYFISHQVNPEFELDKQFLTGAQQQIFQNDAIASAQPLSSPTDAINTPTEVSNKFDTISYSKGGSAIRMMSYILGDEFQPGLQKYLNDNNHKNADPELLFSAFTGAGLPQKQNLSTIMHDWIYKSGFPYITVSLNNKKLEITEKRFLLDEAENQEATWHVPLTYTTASDQNKFTKTAPSNWLSNENDYKLILDFDSSDWIIFNNQGSGYYRVNYDSTLWSRISAALRKQNFDNIHELNRAQLVDDVFNLARINAVPYKTAFDVASYLVNETSYHVWSSTFNSFAFLRKRTGSSELGNAISQLLATFMKKSTEEISFVIKDTDKTIDILAQTQTLTWACDLGNKECAEGATKEFDKYKTGTSIHPDLRTVVYCSAIRTSTNPKSDWEVLWGNYSVASAAEKNVILTALGCTKDEAILEDYLAKSINETSGIRKQDGVFAFKAVYTGNPEGVDIAFKFLKENHKQISAYYKGMGSLSSLLTGVVDRFTTQQQLNDLKQFLETEDLSDEFKIVGAQSLGSATSNVQWLHKFEKELNKIFNLDDGSGDAASVRAGVMLIVALLVSLFHI